MIEQLFSDRYKIQGELGKGGMATVYHAIDTRFKRDVAIKVMPREFLHDGAFFRRFEREAKTVAALEHPAIVPVYDFGKNDGQPFLVMGYMSGGSLGDRIRSGPLPLDELVPILGRVAEALDWSHSQGIIHRDVKPANILFDRHGFAYLADFGIVKLGEADVTSQLTGGGVIGTPAYMAPEMTGEDSPTYLIDVYALGVTLYEALAGKRPYKASTTLGVLMAHANSPIPDIREARPDLPVGVQAVIERGMAKDPSERFQSASALAAALLEAKSTSISPAAAMPDAPTMDVSEKVPTPAQQLVTPDVSPRPALPWTWIGVIGAILVVGIVGLIALFNRNPPAAEELIQTEALAAAVTETAVPTEALFAAPTDQPTSDPPTPTISPMPAPTLNPILSLAETGVSSNDEWDPYLQEFDGVPMALVPAGCFMMGSEDGDSDESPVHKVCFDKPFWIDVYEVTNGQYGSASEDCIGFSSENNQPHTCIDWFDASAYCESRGVRLPTEAEWEYAARGPDELIFPWGNEFWGDYVVYTANDPGVTVEVGHRAEGVSWIRAYDLSGNIAEWVSDWYGDDYYIGSPTENPQGPTGGETHVLRGGSWVSDVFDLRTSRRKEFYPDSTSYYIGFRCARSYDD